MRSWPIFTIQYVILDFELHLDFFYNNALTQLVTQPTRVGGTSRNGSIVFCNDSNFVPNVQMKLMGDETNSMTTRSVLGLGRHMPDTFASSHLTANSHDTISAAVTAKFNTTMSTPPSPHAGVDFVPVVTETSGVCGKQVIDLVNETGHRTTSLTHEPRSTYLGGRVYSSVRRFPETFS